MRITKRKFLISGLSIPSAYAAYGSKAGVNHRKSEDRFPVLDSEAGAQNTEFPVGNVFRYGAVGDGLADDTIPLKLAFQNAIKISGVMEIPDGTFLCRDAIGTATSPIRIVGKGSDYSIIKIDGSIDRPLLSIMECWRDGNGEDHHDAIVRKHLGRNRFVIRGLTIESDRKYKVNGISFEQRNDNVLIDDVRIYYVNGCALSFGQGDYGIVRESTFRDIILLGCGNASRSALSITTGKETSASSNHITFYNLRIIYPHGTGISILNEKNKRSGSALTSRIDFYGLMMHGLNEEKMHDANHLVIIRGLVSDINIYGLRANGSTTGSDGAVYSVISFEDDGFGNSPSRINISGNIRVCKGDVYNISAVNGLIIDGFIQSNAVKGADLIVEDAATKKDIIYRVIAEKKSITRIGRHVSKFLKKY